MRGKIRIMILILVFAVLVVEAYYLIILPGSFVTTYSTSDPKEFNKPPTDQLIVEINGYVFNYKIPHKIKSDNFKEIKALIKNNQIGTIDSLIVIANWVRSKLRFGTPDSSDRKFLVEEIMNNPKNKHSSVLCDSYARLYVIACQSLGIPARMVELNGHIVSEAFIKKTGKWVMIDSVFGYYMTKYLSPLSVLDIINSYKIDIPLKPVVFAESEKDDCLYETQDDINLKNIYLNGFTVVSNQNLSRKSIRDTIIKNLQFPIAKIQFMDTNSILIGYKEKILRYTLMITFIIFIIILIVIFLQRRQEVLK